jgi:hypothetical protein
LSARGGPDEASPVDVGVDADAHVHQGGVSKPSSQFIHHGEVNSPLRQQVLGTASRKSNEYFISEEVLDGDVVHNLRSEAVYTVPVDAQSFANMVNCQTNPDGSISSLAWNAKTSNRLLCSSTFTKCMDKLPLFCLHFDARYTHKSVHSRFTGKPAERPSCVTDDLVMKCDGHCSHKRDHCRSTFVIGFTEADIRGFWMAVLLLFL